MPYKLIRLIFTLVALGGLAGFGYTLYDFIQKKDSEYMQPVDLEGIRDGFAPPVENEKESHLPDWYDGHFKVVYELNVTGKLPVVEKGPEGEKPPPPKKKIQPADLRLIFIQASPDPASSKAYIKPTEAMREPMKLKPTGGLYGPGDEFTIPKEPKVAITVQDIRDREVELAVEGQEGVIELALARLEVDTDQIRPLSQVSRSELEGEPPVPEPEGGEEAPEETVEVSPDTFEVGQGDVAILSEMPEDQLVAELPVSVERDSDSGQIRGLRVGEIRENSVFTRMGARAGDVILSVNGQPATDRTELLRWLRSQGESGVRSFAVEVERLGGVRTITLRLPRNLRR